MTAAAAAAGNIISQSSSNGGTNDGRSSSSSSKSSIFKNTNNNNKGRRHRHTNKRLGTNVVLLPLWLWMGGIVRRYCRRPAVLAVLTLVGMISLTVHRMIAWKLNTQTWAPAPIQFLSRDCPAVDYPTLSSTSSSSTSSTSTSSTSSTSTNTSTSSTSSTNTNTKNNISICVTTLTDQQQADTAQKLLKWRQFDTLLAMTWPNKQAYCDKHGYHLVDSSYLLDNSRPPSWSKIKAVYHLLEYGIPIPVPAVTVPAVPVTTTTTTSLEDESKSKSKMTQTKLQEQQQQQQHRHYQHCDWVVWLDADTVIMNSEKRFEDIIPAPVRRRRRRPRSENHNDTDTDDTDDTDNDDTDIDDDVGPDFVVTRQKSDSYNAGAWMIRNSKWSKHFLNTWWNMNDYVRVKGLSVSGDNDALYAYLTQRMPPTEWERHVVVPPRCSFNSVTKWITPQQAQEYQQHPETIQQEPWYMHSEYYHKGDLIAHVAGRNNKIDTTEELLRYAT